MKNVLLALSLLLLSALPALAQTHPCDQTVTQNPTLTSPVRAGFCLPVNDVNGAAISYTSFRVQLDGITNVFVGALSPVGAPSTSGFNFYQTPTFVVNKGSHTAVAYASTVDGEGAASSPFTFVVAGNLPPAPTKLRVSK